MHPTLVSNVLFKKAEKVKFVVQKHASVASLYTCLQIQEQRIVAFVHAYGKIHNQVVIHSTSKWHWNAKSVIAKRRRFPSTIYYSISTLLNQSRHSIATMSKHPLSVIYAHSIRSIESRKCQGIENSPNPKEKMYKNEALPW